MRIFFTAPVLWLLGIGSLFGFYHFAFTVDDTFVNMRYADNVANGLGAVFNHGEEVEGFSTPLWVMLLVVVGKLPGDLLLYSKILSFFFFLAGGVFLINTVREWRADSKVTMLLYVSSAPLIIWGVSGVAVSLYAFLYLCLFKYTWESQKKTADWKLGAVIFLLLLSSPSAPLICMYCVFIFFLNKNISVKYFSYLLAGSIAILTGVTFYFGDAAWQIFSQEHFIRSTDSALLYFPYFASYFLGPGLVFFIGTILSWRWLGQRKTIFVMIFILGILIFGTGIRNDTMPAWRMLVPVIPVCILMLGVLFGKMKNRMALIRLRSFTYIGLFSYCISNLIISYHFLPENWKVPNLIVIKSSIGNWNPNYERVVQWLKRNKQHVRTVALGEPGYIGYYTEVDCMDLNGFTEKNIARSSDYPRYLGDDLPLHRQGFSDSDAGKFILKKDPDVIILSKKSTKGPKDFVMDGTYHKVKEIGNFQIYVRSMSSSNMDIG